MSETDLPLPKPTALSQPFWDAANQNKFVLQRCDKCGTFRWTPQILCTHCQAPEFTWTEASGRAKVYSFTIVHRAPLTAFKTPYLLATVELEEGPLMLTQLVGMKPEEAAIDMPLRISFTRASDEINLYTFGPAR